MKSYSAGGIKLWGKRMATGLNNASWKLILGYCIFCEQISYAIYYSNKNVLYC